MGPREKKFWNDYWAECARDATEKQRIRELDPSYVPEVGPY
jgi:hypothetical protein